MIDGRFSQRGGDMVMHGVGSNRAVEGAVAPAPAERLPIRPWRDLLAGMGGLLAVCLLSGTTVWYRPGPDVAPATAPWSAVSAARAAAHVRAVAREAHPVGSDAHARVADYIRQAIASVGLEAEVQESTSVQPTRRTNEYRVTRAANVLVKLAGREPRSVLLAAHYDSAGLSPGAADNGSAVAAMLETMRALAPGGPRRNGVIFLFTDAEESGLVGARAFVERHRWAREVGLVLNFDARGSSGPVVMFETGAHAGWTIDQVLEAAPYLVADSLAPTLYRYMPNSTDFAVFRRLGVPGANFALVEGWTNYHSPLDRPERLSAVSLQRQCDLMYALAGHFSDIDLSGPSGAPRLYFNPPWLSSVSVPRLWMAVVFIGAAIVVLALVVRLLRMRELRLWAIGVGALAPLCAAAAGVVIGQQIVRLLLGTSRAMVFHHAAYTSGLLLAGAGISGAAYFAASTPRTIRSVFAGHLVLLALLVILITLLEADVSHILGAPLIAGAACLLMLPSIKSRRRGARLWMAAAVAAATAFFFAPLLWMGLLAAPGREHLMLGVLPLATGFWLPLRELLSRRAIAAWCVVSVVGIAVLLYLLVAGADPRYPTRNEALHIADVDAGTATWVVNRLDPWTRQFVQQSNTRVALSDVLPAWYVGPSHPRERYGAPAQPVSRAAPVMTIVEDVRLTGGRRLRLRIDSDAPSREFAIRLVADTPITEARLNGLLLADGGRRRSGMTPAGDASSSGREILIQTLGVATPVELSFAIGAAGRVSMQVIQRSGGLPIPLHSSFKTRTERMIEGGMGDSAYVVRSFVI